VYSFLREVLYLFIVCGLLFIVLLIMYYDIRYLRKENKMLRRIIEKHIREKKGEGEDSRDPVEEEKAGGEGKD